MGVNDIMEKITLVLSNEDKELEKELKKLGLNAEKVKSEFFNGTAELSTLLINVAPEIVSALLSIIILSKNKYKKSKFKYKGIELDGYSPKEIEKILNMIAKKNWLHSTHDEKKDK